MTEATITTIVVTMVGAIPPTILSMAAWRSSRSADKSAKAAAATAALSADSTARTVEATEHKATELIEKSAEIHKLVNSNLTAVKSDLAVANEKIATLQSLVEKLTGRLEPKEGE